MATRKKSKEFQEYFTEYSQWENVLVDSVQSKSLLIVDAHSTWCGNCQAIVETFKRIYLEKAEDYPIRFCVVDSEMVLKSLEEAGADENNVRDSYVSFFQPIAGKSQPHFLFFLSGVLRKSVTGVNTPIIQKTVDRLLADIDEGKNTGQEDMLETDEDENDLPDESDEATKPQNAEENVPPLATMAAEQKDIQKSGGVATGTDPSTDAQFFDDKTTMQSPPASARSSISARSQKGYDMLALRVFVSEDGKRVYGTANDAPIEGYTEDADASLGFLVAPSTEDDTLRKAVHLFYNDSTKESVLISAPDAIQEYANAEAWEDKAFLGYLLNDASSGLVPLHDLSKDDSHVYTTDTEKLTSEGYTDNGVMGYISTSAQGPQDVISQANSQANSLAPTPRDESTEAEEKTTEESPENDQTAETTAESKEADNTQAVDRVKNSSNNLFIEIDFAGSPEEMPKDGSVRLVVQPEKDSWTQLFTMDNGFITNVATGLRLTHGAQENPFAVLLPAADNDKKQEWTMEGNCLISAHDQLGLTIAAQEAGSQVDIRPFDVSAPPTDCNWDFVSSSPSEEEPKSTEAEASEQ
eukprot:CAMPEP_0117443546 /NCGR_PEP_ID=MMETSP0759-20121206/4749_1 /TAXON_ID=63605 /ORGANISM="Percolomonas cosmopolitus, Strain WS" /LENGTH=580 /DNA_ID=CAMNT_0005235521 /DNA_START=38 /DNA_END=1780 /DNA_ORIENTATION=+